MLSFCSSISGTFISAATFRMVIAVLSLVGVDLAIRLKILPRNRSNQDGLDACSARFGHILAQILLVVAGIGQRTVATKRRSAWSGQSAGARLAAGGRLNTTSLWPNWISM